MTDQTLNELLAALPAAEGEEGLPEILADLARRPVPTSSLHRLWTLGELSAQIALAYGALWVRGWFADAESRQRQVLETNLRTALRLFQRLAYLRGAMIKLGQVAGHFPQMVPREMVEVLDRLHSEAPPMHYALIREVIESELGGEPEKLFASFERDAFAAASLGQVHRARLHTGEAVAVKIQYPGIARTIDADFRNLGALLFPLRLSADWEYVKAQFEEIRRMLRQEVDYRQEADSMRKARALFMPEDGIVVPRVYEQYSTGRVLTADLVDGRHLDAFLATQPSQALRNHFGAAIMRSKLRQYYAGVNYADPHPGNYLFLEDGRLGLLDFGCVQNYDAVERELQALTERWVSGEEGVIPRLLQLICGLQPGDEASETYLAVLRQNYNWMMEPLDATGPFDYGDGDYLRRGLERLTAAARDRTLRVHRTYLYYYRSVFGLFAMLYRLRAQVEVRPVHAAEAQRRA